MQAFIVSNPFCHVHPIPFILPMNRDRHRFQRNAFIPYGSITSLENAIENDIKK